ncbi:hypothetical protein DRN87_01885 [Candidatus Geothermarchaeota archaeon]|nr:MAG: hypothetical protein DRN87_01885 [Candidatus Geothermarchaeota archaeon]
MSWLVVDMLFKDFIRICMRIGSTSSITEKKNIVATYLKELERSEWKSFILFLVGKPIPDSIEGGLGVGYSTIMKALKNPIKPLFPSNPLTLNDVFNELIKIAYIRGKDSSKRKFEALASLMGRMSREERIWLSKIILGELRIGLVDGHLLGALSNVLGLSLEDIRRAYLLRGDLGDVVDVALKGVEALRNVPPRLFSPIRPMLATPASSIAEAYNMIGGGEAAVEVKYDGARVQIHIKNGRVKIFSRRLTDVTYSLPDVVEIVRNGVSVDEAILEGEVVAYERGSGKPLPFQTLMKRFKRIYNIEEAMELIPLKIHLFEIIYLNGKLLIDTPYSDRYDLLVERVSEELLANRIVTSNIREAESFYKRALDYGHEGVMVKRLNSPYILGVRGKHWIKVKSKETLDLVIVGAEWGHGRRSSWLSDYYLAVYDPNSGEYLVVGKTFKGLTDEEFQYMTKRLLELKVKDEGFRIWVNPEIVVEVDFNEIQKSPKYKSGLALRLARITRIREDKSPEEAATLEELYQLYERQFEKKGKVI